jgi:hypothetical protein
VIHTGKNRKKSSAIKKSKFSILFVVTERSCDKIKSKTPKSSFDDTEEDRSQHTLDTEAREAAWKEFEESGVNEESLHAAHRESLSSLGCSGSINNNIFTGFSPSSENQHGQVETYHRADHDTSDIVVEGSRSGRLIV